MRKMWHGGGGGWWRPQSTHRVAIADFWRTFHHDGKISPGWWGWGVHAHPLSAYWYHHVQSCSVRSCWVGRYTHPVSSLPIYVLCGRDGPGVSGWRSSARAWLPALQAGQVALQRLKQTARRLIFTTSITFKLTWTEMGITKNKNP